MIRLATILALLGLGFLSPGRAQPFFLFPTANRALLEPGAEDRFLVGTVGKPCTSGGFGCVRSEGLRLHEGLDIKCLQRDKAGEPTDPVLATAEGVVVYLSAKPALSNYGRYILLRHQVQGLEVYSLYAHLARIRSDLKVGQKVRAGEPVAVMGRSTNTRQAISKDRAHVHFELDLRVSDRFASWHKTREPDQRNDHGEWNGQNFLGFDPAQVLRDQAAHGAGFNLPRLIQDQPELCRVQVRAVSFSWLKRYPSLVVRNAKAEREGTAGYELTLAFNGIPIRAIPRAASEIERKQKFRVVAVNEAEQRKNPCGKLVVRRNGVWELSHNGERLLDLLTY